jgi:hypothetical protein
MQKQQKLREIMQENFVQLLQKNGGFFIRLTGILFLQITSDNVLAKKHLISRL